MAVTKEDIIRELNRRAEEEKAAQPGPSALSRAGAAALATGMGGTMLPGHLLETLAGKGPVGIMEEPGRALSQGVGQLNAFTGGLAPDAYATAQSANSVLKNLVGVQTPTYDQNKGAAQEVIAGAMDEYPTSSGLGAIEGAMAQAYLTGGKGGGFKAAGGTGNALQQAISGATGGYSAVAGADPYATPAEKATGAVAGTFASGLFGILGKVMGGTGKLAGDLELGKRGMGAKYNKLLGHVSSIDDASGKAAEKISGIAKNKELILSKLDEVDSAAIMPPIEIRSNIGGATQNPMKADVVTTVADDYLQAGDKISSDILRPIAEKMEKGIPITRMEALHLKQALAGEVYLPSGKLRNTTSSEVMEKWVNYFREQAIDSIPDANLRLRVKEADVNMTDLYALIRQIDKAKERPISISISGLTKATLGKPATFNRLINAGGALQQSGGVGGTTATAVGNQVFND